MKKPILTLLLFAVVVAANAQFQSLSFVNGLEIGSISRSPNISDFYQTSEPYFAVRTGVDVAFKLKNRLQWRTGVHFFKTSILPEARFFEECSVGSPIHIPQSQSTTALEIPLGVRYFLKSKSQWQSYFDAFGSYNFCFAGEFFTPQNFGQLGIAYGIEYLLRPKLAFFAQPTFRYGISAVAYERFRNYSLSLEFGVRWKRK